MRFAQHQPNAPLIPTAKTENCLHSECSHGSSFPYQIPLFSESLTDVIIYNVADDPKKKNRGFAFLEYDSHKSASVAKRKLGNGRQRVWNCDIIVDWADPQEEPDEDTMAKVCCFPMVADHFVVLVILSHL